MKIALDFDNVLADTIKDWITYYNRNYHKKLTKDKITAYNFWGNNLPMTKREAMEIFYAVWTNWTWLPPTEGYLVSKVENIQASGIVDIVTSVPESHIQYVGKWIKEHGIPHRRIVRCNSEDKVTLPYDIYIDDAPALARDCINGTFGRKQCMIYDQPWNRNINGNNTTRIYTLAEAASVISKVSSLIS
jgi:5'(3')-deoxyribonucleotidase